MRSLRSLGNGEFEYCYRIVFHTILSQGTDHKVLSLLKEPHETILLQYKGALLVFPLWRNVIWVKMYFGVFLCCFGTWSNYIALLPIVHAVFIHKLENVLTCTKDHLQLAFTICSARTAMLTSGHVMPAMYTFYIQTLRKDIAGACLSRKRRSSGPAFSTSTRTIYKKDRHHIYESTPHNYKKILKIPLLRE